eukprot:COSAG02_NODE_74990_length_151_cov_29.000000_1_plen_28_part_01
MDWAGLGCAEGLCWAVLGCGEGLWWAVV